MNPFRMILWPACFVCAAAALSVSALAIVSAVHTPRYAGYTRSEAWNNMRWVLFDKANSDDVSRQARFWRVTQPPVHSQWALGRKAWRFDLRNIHTNQHECVFVYHRGGDDFDLEYFGQDCNPQLDHQPKGVTV